MKREISPPLSERSIRELEEWRDMYMSPNALVSCMTHPDSYLELIMDLFSEIIRLRQENEKVEHAAN